jgi:hypothetical protein
LESIHKLDEEKLRKYEEAKALINEVIDKKKSFQAVCSDAVEVKDVYNNSGFVMSSAFIFNMIMSFVLFFVFCYVIKIIAMDAIMSSAEDVILVGERCSE